MFAITVTSTVAKDGSKPVWYLWQKPPKGAKLFLTSRQVRSEIEAIQAQAACEKSDLKGFKALKTFALQGMGRSSGRKNHCWALLRDWISKGLVGNSYSFPFKGFFFSWDPEDFILYFSHFVFVWFFLVFIMHRDIPTKQGRLICFRARNIPQADSCPFEPFEKVHNRPTKQSTSQPTRAIWAPLGTRAALQACLLLKPCSLLRE